MAAGTAGYLPAFGKENMSKSNIAFKIFEPSGKVYRIWPSGRTEGFEEGVIICNGILPMVHLVRQLLKQSVDHGLITAEQAAEVIPDGFFD